MDHSASPPRAESRAARTIREIFESGRPLTYIRSAEEQRVGKVLSEVGRRLSAAAPVPVWTWSLTEGMRRGDGTAEAGTDSARGALDFIVAHEGAAIFHLKDFHEPLRESPEDPPPPARRLRELSGPAEVRRHHFAGPIHSGGNRAQHHVSGTAAAGFGRAGGVSARTRARRNFETKRCSSGRARAARAHTRRSALCVTPRAGGEPQSRSRVVPALLEEKRLLVNRSGVIEYISDGTNTGRGRRSRRSQEMAAGAPQTFSDARQSERGNRAQGRPDDGHSGLRQEPLRQGHRVIVSSFRCIAWT